MRNCYHEMYHIGSFHLGFDPKLSLENEGFYVSTLNHPIVERPASAKGVTGVHGDRLSAACSLVDQCICLLPGELCGLPRKCTIVHKVEHWRKFLHGSFRSTLGRFDPFWCFLKSRVGYYTEPISVCDFASLYPSIMRAHNMCYCTRIPRNVAVNLPPEDVTVAPTGERFVKAHVRPGLLPEILTFLTDARKKAKADMKNAKDALEKAVLDGRQNALKVGELRSPITP